MRNPQFSVEVAEMDKYLVPAEQLPENPKPKLRRHSWKLSAVELNGRFGPKNRHDLYGLLTNSFSEIGSFPHFYHVNGKPCQTHIIETEDTVVPGFHISRTGVSAVEFDTKGIYLVSATRSGCLMVQDFESLYCQSKDSSSRQEDESKHVLHFSLPLQIDSVRWNPTNQDEVACSSANSNELNIFDIGYISSKPIEVLQTRQKLSVLGSAVHRGLCDVAFTINDKSSVIASDTHGIINVWDRRVGGLPCIELSSNSDCTINSVRTNVDNQTVFGAGRQGIIYIWDLRGGRTSAAFQSHKEACHLPLASMHLATMLRKIGSLTAQSDIVSKQIHTIDLNPSCPYQLAFHLDDGWSGVLDIYRSEVTHLHCPPPPWLSGSNNMSGLLNFRKPTWLPSSSIYVVGSVSKKGIHLLDFYPDSTSPTHVDFNEDLESKKEKRQEMRQNRFVPLSIGVDVCAAHPSSSTIMAGTKNSYLLMISQRLEPSAPESMPESTQVSTE